MLNFYNLYEFMNIMSYYIEQDNNSNAAVKGVGRKVTTLKYSFACNMASYDKRDRNRLYGTGGKSDNIANKFFRIILCAA